MFDINLLIGLLDWCMYCSDVPHVSYDPRLHYITWFNRYFGTVIIQRWWIPYDDGRGMPGMGEEEEEETEEVR